MATSSSDPHSSTSGKVRIFRTSIMLLWALALTFLSLASNIDAPVNLRLWDKFSHFAAYAVLSLLLIRTLSSWHGITVRLLIVVCLTSTVFGLFLEYLQWLMQTGRQWEFGDLLANALGALAACVVFRLIGMRSSVTNDQ